MTHHPGHTPGADEPATRPGHAVVSHDLQHAGHPAPGDEHPAPAEPAPAAHGHPHHTDGPDHGGHDGHAASGGHGAHGGHGGHGDHAAQFRDRFW